MALERTGKRELAELVPDHIFRDVYRNMLSTVMNGDGMTDKLRENSRCARPGLKNLLLALLIHGNDSVIQLLFHERSFLQTSAHLFCLLICCHGVSR